jgi:SAM-dependent methyltransferase
MRAKAMQDKNGSEVRVAPPVHDGWTQFWNGPTTIYVNERHKRVHYQHIALDMIALLPRPGLRVLDYGCGEALCADVVGHYCGQLVLCDAAETVRAGLSARYAHHGNISIAAPDEIAAMADGSFDLIVANSVMQYLPRGHVSAQIAEWRRLLAPGGSLVLGDVIPEKTSALTDAAALLRFARVHGFLFAACLGLVRTFFSNYRTLRAQHGLLRFSEQDIIDLARGCGLDARRRSTNLGHNPARMTLTAQVVSQRAPGLLRTA